MPPDPKTYHPFEIDVPATRDALIGICKCGLPRPNKVHDPKAPTPVTKLTELEWNEVELAFDQLRQDRQNNNDSVRVLDRAWNKLIIHRRNKEI